MLTIVEMPALSSTMKTGKVVKWCKKEGDSVDKGEVLFEVETDKVNVEVESLASGWLRKVLIQEGIDVPVNTPIAIISETMDEDISSVMDAAPSPQTPLDQEEPEMEPEQAKRKIAKPKISPLARRIAEEKGIDIQTIKGTGPEGRITRKDVEAAVDEASMTAQRPIEPTAKYDVPPEGEDYEDIPLTKMRKVVAKRLQESKVTAPHFYVDVTADATELTIFKEMLEKNSEKFNTRITFNDIIIKLVSQALKEYPMVNATFLPDRIRLYRAVHIGVAVAMDEGLVVPVIRNTDQKSISQISREVTERVEKARHKKLLPAEYTGGTFTVTNLGMFGVESFHAIINPPESAILAVSAIIEKPVVVDDEIKIRPCLALSLAVDHRVVDGAMAARFLARVKELIETPALMLVQR